MKIKGGTLDLFNLKGRTAIITGGAGFLGPRHAEALLDAGASVILVDINNDRLKEVEAKLRERFGQRVSGYSCDITSEKKVASFFEKVVKKHGFVDILINNAANNPHVTSAGLKNLTRFENFPISTWNEDFAIGVTGAFLMSRYFGQEMAKKKKGVILNIASELSITAPNQRLYRKKGLPEGKQPVKPVSYSVVKHGIVGLSKYLSTYWADKKVRVNSVSFGGVYNDQPPSFLRRINKLIPLGRMARDGEYKGIVLFLCSDASSYMTGENVVVDGGRTVW